MLEIWKTYLVIWKFARYIFFFSKIWKIARYIFTVRGEIWCEEDLYYEYVQYQIWYKIDLDEGACLNFYCTIKTFHQGSLGLGSIMRSLCRGLVGTYPIPKFKTIIVMVRSKFIMCHISFLRLKLLFCISYLLVGWKPCFNVECVTVARNRDQKTSGLWRRTCSQFSASKRGWWRRMFW